MKKIGKLLSVVLAVTLLISAIITPDFPAKASTPMAPEALSANDTWIGGEIVTKGTADYYRVTIPKDGWLTINYQAWSLDCSYWSVLDNDCVKQYHRESVYGSSSQNPKTRTATLALEKGSYIIKIEGVNSSHTDLGEYRVKASFKAANNNESTVNDNFETAQNLSWNQLVTGFISIDDRIDFYKVNLSSKTTIRLVYNSYISGTTMMIYDKDRIQVHRNSIYNGAEGNPKTYQYEETLNPGTYYIRITPNDYGSNCGRYTLKLIKKIQTKSISIKANKANGKVYAGQTVKLTATVTPSNTTDKTVTWMSSDPWIASVDKTTGKVTTYKAGKVYIKATAMDGSNISKSYKLIIKPKKSNAPYVSSSGSGRLYVSYGGQSNVKGYQIQYATNSRFKNAKTKNTTKTYYTLRNLKKNKRYYVRVRSYIKDGKKFYYSNWSNKKSCRTKR